MNMQSKIIKQEVKLFSVVYPFEGFKSMGVMLSNLRNCVDLKVRFILMVNYSAF